MTRPNYGVSKRLRKKRLNLWLEPKLIERVDAEACSRRVARQEVLESAVYDRYSQESQEERDALIARRLNRLDNRGKAMARDLETTAETLALFIRMWLAVSAEVPEEQRGAAYLNAQARYERFLKSLHKRLNAGQSILTDLPREVVVKEEDFGDEGP
jgi:hypothetical protein